MMSTLLHDRQTDKHRGSYYIDCQLFLHLYVFIMRFEVFIVNICLNILLNTHNFTCGY